MSPRPDLDLLPPTGSTPAPTHTVPRLRRVPRCEPAHEQAATRAMVIHGRPAGRTAVTSRVPWRPDPVSPAALVRAQQVFRLTFEVLEGRRGPRQLQEVVSPEVLAKITTLAREDVRRRGRATARLRRVHVQQITAEAAEACVCVERGNRVHAVAARLELHRTGWRCTAFVLG